MFVYMYVCVCVFMVLISDENLSLHSNDKREVLMILQTLAEVSF